MYNTRTYNSIFGPPSLIRGGEYPISNKAEKMLNAAYQHGYSDAMRMNRAGRLIEDDPLLDLFRKRVEKIRKKKIKRGEMEPANDQERRYV